MNAPEVHPAVPMSAPDINDDDVKAVEDVLRSGRLALGPRIEEFEALVADYVGVDHAVAVSSGTAALHTIVRALGLKSDDEVLVPSFTFAASVNAILYEGAVPVFVDIEPDTYNLDPGDLERKAGPRTKAIMVVDAFGHPAEWDGIQECASRHELRVIDDSCEALGSEYRGRKLGQFGDAAAFAFYPNKQMTTGEGGIIVTGDAEIASLARSLRNQGRDEHGSWLNHAHLGFNYRMDEMSAALGCSQLKRVETFLQKRDRVAGMYAERLAGVKGVRAPQVRPYVRMSWFVYVATLAPGLDRDQVIAAMARRGVPARGYFSAMHLQPYLRGRTATRPGDLPVTEDIGTRTLALPFHNNLSPSEVDLVVGALEESIEECRA